MSSTWTPDHDRRAKVVLWSAVLVLGVGLVVGLTLVTHDLGDDGPTAISAADGSAELLPREALQAPERLPDPGAYVEAVVEPDGSVEVTHWLRPTEGISELTVRAYPTRQVAGPSSVTDLAVRTGRGEVQLTEPFTAGADPRTVTLVRSSRLIELSYTVDGVTDDEGSVVGRALVDSVLADVDHAAELGRTRVELGGREILQLACFPEDGSVADQRSCGTLSDGAWSVDLTSGQLDDKVLAQVDLDHAQSVEPDAGTGLD